MAWVRMSGGGKATAKVEEWNISGNSYTPRTKVVDTTGFSKITIAGGLKGDGANNLSMTVDGVTGKTGGTYNNTLVYITANISGNSVTLGETHNKSGQHLNASYQIILE